MDSVLASIQSVKAQAVLNGGTANPPCPSITTANSTGGAVNAASHETYSLWYEVMLTEPDGPDLSQFGDAVQQLLDRKPQRHDVADGCEGTDPAERLRRASQLLRSHGLNAGAEPRQHLLRGCGGRR